MNPVSLRRIVDRALEEDLAWGDISTESVLPDPLSMSQASISAKEDGVIAGNDAARAVFSILDPQMDYRVLVPDGSACRKNDRVAEVRGRARAMLSGERVALNFLAHMSGIATATRAMVDLVSDLPAKIIDTRKTTPGLRALEKYAVRMGGGFNHRFDLSAAVLLKENHIQLAGGITHAVEAARSRGGHTVLVQVEVVDIAGVEEGLGVGADALLLDNMDTATMADAVKLAAGRIPLEASGGVRPETVRAIAEAGVDLISVGYLTHSAPALDLSMLIEGER